MMHAYNEEYVYEVMENLGTMLEYAVRDLGIEAEDFMTMFQTSGLAHEVGRGNPKYAVGMSGVELGRDVYHATYNQATDVEFQLEFHKSPAYWAGWALAYYQWKSGLTFEKILSFVDMDKIINLYNTHHEADVEYFVETMNGFIEFRKKDATSPLAKYRKLNQLSQRQLSEKTDVTLRMIQLYEQRQNDINKASIQTVIRLASALGCKVEDLLE